MNDGEREQGELLAATARVGVPALVRAERLAGDGSARVFYRLRFSDAETSIAILPPPGEPRGMAEARAAWRIGRHLCATGAPTPALLGFDEASGLLLCEDLGETLLHDQVLAARQGGDWGPARRGYFLAVEALARMQVRAAQGFDPAWCWDTPRYDRPLMRSRESGYFLQALCIDLLGLDLDQAALGAEFDHLAWAAAQAPSGFFLHRDFQCRNVMVLHGRPRFIDFQGGRLGPLGYDLASLLIDPYAALPRDLAGELLERYLNVLAGELAYDRERFLGEYRLLAMQRNLQILGAFAFLGFQRGKPFFRVYLRPALDSLLGLLAATPYPAIEDAARQCRAALPGIEAKRDAEYPCLFTGEMAT